MFCVLEGDYQVQCTPKGSKPAWTLEARLLRPFRRLPAPQSGPSIPEPTAQMHTLGYIRLSALDGAVQDMRLVEHISK